MCKVYTGYCGTSEIEHGLCACTVDNPLAKAQPMLYLPLVVWTTEFPLMYDNPLAKAQPMLYLPLVVWTTEFPLMYLWV